MLGKTHITLGMASALAITHPTTIPGVVAAMTGGAIGGWIVDIDCKNMDADREKVYDTIIDALFINALVILDFFIGDGICSYVIENWGVQVWGALLGLIILMLLGYNTKHRTFTHSFLGMALFCGAVYLFCKPICIPFAIGYASHIIADFFNKLGIQLFFPILKWRPCLKLCASNKKVNKYLFWIALLIDVILGAFFFAVSMINAENSTTLIQSAQINRFLGLNALQCYLIFINLITCIGFQRSYRKSDREVEAEKDDEVRIALEFETWILNFLVFIGGGFGMLIILVIHRAYPAGYNGNWWSFCYTSILFWFTVYCYICNPFGWEDKEIKWLSASHIPLLVYILGINTISALLFYSFRKKHFDEYSPKHTLLLIAGALGGTIGAIPVVIGYHRTDTYNYAVIGFPVMIISQIIFIIYMISVGIF